MVQASGNHSPILRPFGHFDKRAPWEEKSAEGHSGSSTLVDRIVSAGGFQLRVQSSLQEAGNAQQLFLLHLYLGAVMVSCS